MTGNASVQADCLREAGEFIERDAAGAVGISSSARFYDKTKEEADHSS